MVPRQGGTEDVMKMTFAKGTSHSEDPLGIVQLEPGRQRRRAIDFHKGDKVDEKALKALRSLHRRSGIQPAATDAGGGLFGGDVEDERDVSGGRASSWRRVMSGLRSSRA